MDLMRIRAWAIGLLLLLGGCSDGGGGLGLHQQVRKPDHDAGCNAAYPTFRGDAVTAKAPDQKMIFRDEPGQALKKFIADPKKGGWLSNTGPVEWTVLDRSDDVVVYAPRASGVNAGFALIDRGHGTWKIASWGECDPRWLRTMTWSPQAPDPSATGLTLAVNSGWCGGVETAPRAG